MEDKWPVLAFAVDLGSTKGTETPIVFSVGHFRDPVVGYIVDSAQIQNRHPYYMTQYPSVLDAVRRFFLTYGSYVV